MTCTFCVTENSIDTMTMPQVLELLDQLVSQGVTNVVLGGGEPFTWPHNVVTLAGHAKALGLTVQVGTNGIRLPSQFASLDCIDRFVLPLDSVFDTVHNQMRIYSKGHHALIYDRLQALQEAGKEVTISTVVTKQNIQHLVEIAKFLNDYCRTGGRVHAWHLYRFLPYGRGGFTHATYHGVLETDYQQAIGQLKKKLWPFTIYKRKDMYGSKTVSFYSYENGQLVVMGAQNISYSVVPLDP